MLDMRNAIKWAMQGSARGYELVTYFANLKYYLHSSDANERKAVEALEGLVARETAVKND